MASIWHEDRLLIDGELVGAEGGATFDTISPSTEDVLGTAANASMGDTKRAISAARRAFDITEWSRDVALRRHCLQQLHQALVDNAEQLRTIVVQEVGAPVMLTYGPQLDSPTALVGWYADLLDRYDFSTDLGQGEFFGSMHHRWMEREAAGVVAAITAYNYPIQLALAKLAPALAAGCSVVLKAAPDTPWSALALGKLAAEATDLPPGVLNVLASDDNAVGVELTTNPDIDLISFTGSTAVGRAIQAAAAPTVKKVFLELGGKSASVVLDDADLAMAATFCAFAVMSHAGQGCAITTRLVVPRERYDEAVQTAATVMAAGKVGNPAEPDTMVGPLINARQREKVAGYVERAVAAGAGRPAARRRRRRGADREQLDLRPVDERHRRRPGPRAGCRPPHPRRHGQRQRWRVLRPRDTVRRLQAVRHRPGERRRRTRGVPRDQGIRRTSRLSRAGENRTGRARCLNRRPGSSPSPAPAPGSAGPRPSHSPASAGASRSAAVASTSSRRPRTW